MYTVDPGTAPGPVGDAVALALLLWLPFGPFFAGGVFMDARWRRERDREVGDGWYLSLVSVVVQAAAFWYLLRRATKYAGARSGPVAGTESG